MLLIRILSYIHKYILSVYWRKKFITFGNNSRIIKPLHIIGNKIKIGNNVLIQYKSWLASKSYNEGTESLLEIHDGCVIGHFNEIYATKCIVLEKNVLTADRVYISDNLHGYENPDIPVMKQSIKQIGTVRIGEGSWIGVGVSVIGANIGKHCVIGANSVVTHDIPDYSVAVGIPAKVIKKYDFKSKAWLRI